MWDLYDFLSTDSLMLLSAIEEEKEQEKTEYIDFDNIPKDYLENVEHEKLYSDF
jgi:hypothetical protein